MKNRDKEKEKRGNSTKKDNGSACQIRSRRRRKRNHIKGQVGANNLCDEAGIFVQGNLNGSSAKLLIDTGAFLTLVSRRFYDKLQNEERPELTESAQRILNASGSVVSHYGKGTFSFQIGKSNQVLEAIVADISVDGIIGLDFLRKCNGNIDLQASSLRLNDEECAFS